jgi:hypothetical protein
VVFFVVAFFAPLVDENPVCITEEVRFAVDSPARGRDSKPPFPSSERRSAACGPEPR